MRDEAIDLLLATVPDEYRDPVSSWNVSDYPSHYVLDQMVENIVRRIIRYIPGGDWNVSDYPSHYVLDHLIELQQEQPPYADLLLGYAVRNSEPKLVEKRIRYLSKKWKEMWISQGRPLTFEELDRTTSLADLRQHSGAVAYQVLAHITDPTSPLLKDVRTILPGEYLPPLGLANLAGYIPAAILKLADQRFACQGGAVPKEHEAIIKRIYHLRKKPYASELMLAVTVLTGEEVRDSERNSPNSVLRILTQTAALFQDVFEKYSLPSLSAFDPDLHLKLHFKDDTSSYFRSVRAAHISAYLDCTNAEYRWERACPQLKATVAPWRLRAPEGHIDLEQAFTEARHEERERRHALADALSEVYLPTLSVVIRRAMVFKEVAAASEEAHARFASLSAGEDHYPFEVCLSDGSATLRFVIWAAAALAGDRSLTRQVSALNPESPLETLVEYVGAVDACGRPLPDAFFALVQRAWYNQEFRPQILKYGGPESDYIGTWPGLLRPVMRLSAHCHREYVEASRTGREARILFDLRALCTGAAYGAFILMVSYISGMRSHEIQQISGVYPYTSVLKSGHLQCQIYQKGKKRGKKKAFKQKLEPFIIAYWEDLLEAHYRSWGELSFVLPQDGERLGLARGGYLLQADGRPLSQVAMRRLVRFMAFGACHDSTNPDFKSLGIHLMRHGHTRVRKELGHLLSEIQKDVGHACEWMTRHYLGGKNTEDRPKILVDVPLGTLWHSLLPDAIKRIPGDK